MALVGKIVRVAEALRDEPDGLSLQAVVLRKGYIKRAVHLGPAESQKTRLRRARRDRGGYPGGPHLLLVGACVRRHLGRSAGSAFLARPLGRRSLVHLRCLLPTFREARATGYIHSHHGEFTLIQDTNQRIYFSKEG